MGDTGTGTRDAGQSPDPAGLGQDGRGYSQGPIQGGWSQGAQDNRTPSDDDPFLQKLLAAMDSDAFIEALEDETMLKKFKKWLAGFLRPTVRETAPAVSAGSGEMVSRSEARQQEQATWWRTQAQALKQENEGLKNELKQAKQPSYARQQEQKELQELRSRVTALENEKNQLSQSLQRFKAASEAWNQKEKELEATIAGYTGRIQILEETVTARDRQIGSITGHFSEAQRLYEAFQRMDGQTSRELRTIFRGSGLEEFVYCGLQWNRLEALWDYMKDRILNGKDVAGIEPIYNYFFEAYNRTSDKPLYRRTATRVGTSFDTERHIRHQDGRSAGPIASVLLEGYENTSTGKCPKKPVVRL